LGPVPIEVRDRFEALEATSGSTALESATCTVLFLDIDDVFDDLLWSPAFLRCGCDEIVEANSRDGET
jgi:hypothetical protein